MTKISYNLGKLELDEERLVAFYRSQPPLLKEFLMNLTYFEKGLPDAEAVAGTITAKAKAESQNT